MNKYGHDNTRQNIRKNKILKVFVSNEHPQIAIKQHKKI